jgi:translocation and assembly module TamB
VSTSAASPQPRSSRWRAVGRALAIFAAVVIVVGGGALWYASTAQFSNRVRREVIDVLERSTGGRVDLAKFSWHLTKLEVEVDGLTIHGLEGPHEVPYAHLDKLVVRAKIISLLRAQIGLGLLQAEHPVLHLIIYPDGTTNQPVPKAENNTGKPVVDEIFDLAVDDTQLDNGLLIVNQRKIPFNIAAKDLSAKFDYVYANGHYNGSIYVADLTAQGGKAPLVHSKLNLNVDLGRNTASLTGLHLSSGDSGGESTFEASASVKNFADPHWQMAAKGSIDLREVATLAEVEGLGPGTLGLDISGQGESAKVFDINGHASLKDAAYKSSAALVTGLNADTTVRVTQDEIAVPALIVKLRQGGSVDGSAVLLHWLAATPPATGVAAQTTARPIRTKGPEPQQQQAKINLQIHGIRAQTLLEMVAARKYQDLGFDTSLGGTANIAWTGTIAAMTADVKLALAPPVPPGVNEVPVRGVLDASYANHGGRLTVRQLEVHSPGSSLVVTGEASLYPVTGPSSLNIDLSLTNLAEFNRALTVAGVSANGKQGVAALPVSLQGQAGFHGTVTGSLLTPDVKGHLSAKKFSTTLPAAPTQSAPPQTHVVRTGMRGTRPHGKTVPIANPARNPPAANPAPKSTTIQWDDLEADAEYSPALISLQQATLTRGKTSIHVSGQLQAHNVGRPSRPKLVFDDDSSINATATIQNAAVPDLLSIAGQNLPVTGTLNMQAHAGGTLGNLNGGGHVAVNGGTVYQEPYKSLNADLQFAGKQVEVPKFTLLGAGGRITGNGAYDTGNNSFRAKVTGADFKLANVERLQSQSLHPDGNLNFDLQASGTAENPVIGGTVHLNDVVLSGEKIGGLQVQAHTTDGIVFFDMHANLVNAQIVLAGQVAPHGDYQAKAQLSLSHLDVNPILDMLDVQGVKGHSIIDGTVDVEGPLKTPKLLEGDARISQFSVGVQDLKLASQGPLHATLREGVLDIDPIHISGQDTNLTAQGTISLFDTDDNDAGGLNLKAAGSVDVKVAQMFDPEILSSGKIDFNMNAGGTIGQPDLTGQVKFTDVAMSYQQFPSGISQLNGTLVFDQNRLNIKDLTGVSGGGQVKLTGALTFQQGVYTDVKLAASNVRLRYAGISTTADANLRVQGTPKNLLFGGNVLITRFLISPNIDLASLTSSTASPPPNPEAFGNNLRLDVRVASSPQLDFQNSFAQLAGSVDLRIRGTAAQPSILGSINITEGTATFGGTTYQLEHGDIYFTNPVRIEPTIDLDAVTRIEQYDVTIGLHGTVANLQPNFSSEPPLPQADVVSLLALGRTQDEQSIYSQEESDAGVNGTTDALLGSALNATVSGRIQKLFGVGSIKIDPTYQGTLGETSARITVSQNIGKSVTVMFASNVNASAQELIQAQWNINQDLSLTAVRDESDVFSLIFKIHNRYR